MPASDAVLAVPIVDVPVPVRALSVADDNVAVARLPDAEAKNTASRETKAETLGPTAR